MPCAPTGDCFPRFSPGSQMTTDAGPYCFFPIQVFDYFKIFENRDYWKDPPRMLVSSTVFSQSETFCSQRGHLLKLFAAE